MIKKYLIAFLTLISFFWYCYADVIPENSHFIDKCVKIENTSIDGYKPIQIVELHYWNEAYPIEEWKCLEHHYKFWSSYIYLVDENVEVVDYDSVDLEKAIKLDQVRVNWYYEDNGTDDSTSMVEETYRINGGNWNYTLELVSSDKMDYNAQYRYQISEDHGAVKPYYVLMFMIALFFTILIETIVLLILMKGFWKSDKSYWRIILFWIIASSVTLPLLWFVLPLIITDETLYTFVWELWVTAIEIVILKYGLQQSWEKAIIAGLSCNLLSYLFWLFLPQLLEIIF